MCFAMCVCLCLSVCFNLVSACMSLYRHVSVYLSVCMISVCMISVCVSVHLSVCLHVYMCLFAYNVIAYVCFSN